MLPTSYAMDTPDTALILESALVASERSGASDESSKALHEEICLLRQQLQQERLAHALQRANAEQARRVADCLHFFHEALLSTLAQPALILDRSGHVTLWNDALAHWTGLAADAAQGGTLESLFPPSVCAVLNTARITALREIEATSRGSHFIPQQGTLPLSAVIPGGSFSLLPLCRIPGCFESCLVLFAPRF